MSGERSLELAGCKEINDQTGQLFTITKEVLLNAKDGLAKRQVPKYLTCLSKDRAFRVHSNDRTRKQVHADILSGDVGII
jgi:hypothetical protein